jgi:hypothetical protein
VDQQINKTDRFVDGLGGVINIDDDSGGEGEDSMRECQRPRVNRVIECHWE